MADSIFVGDIGTEIVLNVGQDVSDGTAFRIYYKKPNGVTGSWTAELNTSDSTNKSIVFRTIAGSLDIKGTWQFQAHVTTSAGAWYGLIVRQRVYQPLA